MSPLSNEQIKEIAIILLIVSGISLISLGTFIWLSSPLLQGYRNWGQTMYIIGFGLLVNAIFGVARNPKITILEFLVLGIIFAALGYSFSLDSQIDAYNPLSLSGVGILWGTATIIIELWEKKRKKT